MKSNSNDQPEEKKPWYSGILIGIGVALLLAALNALFPSLELLDHLPWGRHSKNLEQPPKILSISAPQMRQHEISLRWRWNIEFGLFKDDIYLENPTGSELSNVSLDINLMVDGQLRNIRLQASKIAPHGKHTWPDVISISEKSFQREQSTATLNAYETGGWTVPKAPSAVLADSPRYPKS